MKKLIRTIGKLLVIVVIGAVGAWGAISWHDGAAWNPIGAPSSVSVTWSHQDAPPSISGKPGWLYLCIDGSVVKKLHVHGTPPELQRPNPLNRSNACNIQAKGVIYGTGSLTVAVHGKMVEEAHGSYVFTHMVLRVVRLTTGAALLANR